MLIEPATGTPNRLALSWRWIMAMTRDLRSASSNFDSSAARVRFSTPRPPKSCTSMMASSASQNAARARLARCAVQGVRAGASIPES